MYETTQHTQRALDTSFAFMNGHSYMQGLDARCYAAQDEDGRVLSMQEKAQFFDIPEENILKTIYFESRGKRLYGAVVPSTKKVDVSALEKRVLEDLSLHERRGVARKHEGVTKLHLRLAKQLPYEMTRGSCGPFPCSKSQMRDQYGRIERGGIIRIVYDASIPMHEIVEFAIPKKRSLSLHTTLESVCSIVNQEHPGILIAGNITKAA